MLTFTFHTVYEDDKVIEQKKRVEDDLHAENRDRRSDSEDDEKKA